MEYIIRQNPKYTDQNPIAGKYFVYKQDGKPIGTRRNVSGILALNPQKLHIKVDTFHDGHSLAHLLLCLGRRKNIEFDFV